MTIKSIVALTLWAGISQAQQPSSEITEGFKKLAPTAKINSANKTPIKGVSQINLKSASIVTDSGILIPTYMPPEALLQKLNQLAAQ